MQYIIYNAGICPDGTLLHCTSSYDYQSHIDVVTGEWYMLDGVGYCIRTSVNTVPMKMLTVTADDPQEQIREVFSWRSYGKSGREPAKDMILKQMTNEHISAILCTQERIKGTPVERVFEQELEYRKANASFKAVSNEYLLKQK
jgi:hypothetical protein